MRGAKETTNPKAVKAKTSKAKPKKRSKEISIISKLIMDDRLNCLKSRPKMKRERPKLEKRQLLLQLEKRQQTIFEHSANIRKKIINSCILSVEINVNKNLANLDRI